MDWDSIGIKLFTKTKGIGGVIKRSSSDFIVNEASKNFKKGDEYLHFTLKKINLNTLDALKILADKLGVSITRFSYAGLKDKKAITTQRISVWKLKEKALKEVKIPEIEVYDFNYSSERIRPGDLKGNEFIISVNESFLNRKELLSVCMDFKKELIPNYFGPQRFGGNEKLGLKLLKNQVKIKDNNLARICVHAYQSLVFNKALSLKGKKVKGLVVPGLDFSSEITDKLMSEEGIKTKDFEGVNSLYFSGGRRDAFIKPERFKVIECSDCFLKLGFFLPKNSYASIVMHELMK